MFARACLLLALSAALTAVTAQLQEVFQHGTLGTNTNAFSSYDDGLFAPIEDLGLISTSGFTTLGHPAFPNYQVRIKKSDFCDGTVKYVCPQTNELTRGRER